MNFRTGRGRLHRRFGRLSFRERSGWWWWVVAKEGDRTVLIGPLRDQDEANTRGYRLGCYFQSLELPTRDHARASQMVKDGRLVSGQPLSEAMRRVSHDRVE